MVSEIVTGSGAEAAGGARRPTIADDDRRRRGIPIAILLGMSLGALVLVAAASVLSISIWSGVQSTLDLLEDQAVLAVDAVEQGLDDHLSPIKEQVRFINDLIVTGQLDPNDDRRLEAVLTGAVAATPQVDGLFFFPDGQPIMRGVARTGGGAFWTEFDERQNPGFRGLNDRVRDLFTARWGDLVYSSVIEVAVLPIEQPVRTDQDFVGTLGAGVSVLKLSRFVSRFESEYGGRTFILRGREQVIAHPSLTARMTGLSAQKPVPLIGEVGDPILARMWTNSTDAVSLGDGESELRGHEIDVGGETWFFLYRWVDDYGEEPWLIGSYFRGSDLEQEFVRLQNAAIAGLVVLVLGVAVAFFIGRRIAGPMRRLAVSAQRIGALEFDRVDPLRPSRMRELNEAASAFNLMLRGLRWFESYVPRKLVHRLMGVEAGRALASEEREVTVMFTDIAGFTTLAEGMAPDATAEFLNRHFELITRCVEAEGGTVDKYIGDGVMAFWGAPERQADHAPRACRAARAIADAIAEDNATRAARGDAPVRVRVGIHTGRVIVGNIGAPDRINYTIVGDTVNICQRIEQLGKSLGPASGAMAIHLSESTRLALDASFAPVSVGRHTLRGRSGDIEIFRLD